MNTIHAEASEVIDARPEEIYTILSDYTSGHPHILPQEYFTSVRVEAGGQGAGTVVRVRMTVYGAVREYRMVVAEPEPGRVLTESDPDAGVITTFTVTPLDDGQHTRVSIATDAKPRAGVAGLVEKVVNPPVTRRIYKKELRQLADVVRSTRAAASRG